MWSQEPSCLPESFTKNTGEQTSSQMAEAMATKIGTTQGDFGRVFFHPEFSLTIVANYKTKNLLCKPFYAPRTSSIKIVI